MRITRTTIWRLNGLVFRPASITITVSLSNDEATALATVEADPQTWAKHAVKGRPTSTLDAIVRSQLDHLMRHDEALPATKSDVLASAVKSGRAIPVSDMAQVDFEAIGKAPEPSTAS